MRIQIKKVGRSFIGLSLAILILAGCSSSNPTDTVTSFFKTFKNGDYKTSMSYIQAPQGSAFAKVDRSSQINGYKTADLMKALATNYSFKNPKVVSKSGDTAKVKVTVTSDDMSVIVTNMISQLMPIAMANASTSSSSHTDKKTNNKNTLTQLTASTFMDSIKAKNAKLATRDVTLNLKKDSNGQYKIVGDKHLIEALMANYSSVQTLFNNSSN